MTSRRLGVAIAGCGNIAGPYGEELAAAPSLALQGVTDLEQAKAESLAVRIGTRVYASLDALLADPAVEAVVNLTTQRAHFEVSRRCLEAGKHVYSEKPLALSHAKAQQLVELAAKLGVRLACAPATYLAEAQGTAWQLMRDGHLGWVRLVYAEANWGRIESWHPSPEAFYDVGVLPDVGIYPLAIFTAIFGPIRRVLAHGTVLYPDRVTKDGRPFHVTTPELVILVAEAADGTILRLTANWYVGQDGSKQTGMEFHGDAGSLYLSSWLHGDARVEIAEGEKRLEPVPLQRQPAKSIVWSRAVTDLARAIEEDRPHRAAGDHAAHLVEIIDAATRSMHEQRPVEVRSSFVAPQPIE